MELDRGMGFKESKSLCMTKLGSVRLCRAMASGGCQFLIM